MLLMEICLRVFLITPATIPVGNFLHKIAAVVKAKGHRKTTAEKLDWRASSVGKVNPYSSNASPAAVVAVAVVAPGCWWCESDRLTKPSVHLI